MIAFTDTKRQLTFLDPAMNLSRKGNFLIRTGAKTLYLMYLFPTQFSVFLRKCSSVWKTETKNVAGALRHPRNHNLKDNKLLPIARKEYLFVFDDEFGICVTPSIPFLTPTEKMTRTPVSIIENHYY